MSTNFIVQIISAVLLAFTASGLNIDPTSTAQQILDVFKSGNYAMLAVLLFNLGNSVWQWIRTLRTNPGTFWSFLRSTNWWQSAINIVIGAIALTGALMPGDLGADVPVDLAMYAANGQWILLLLGVVSNVINILIHKFTENTGKVLVFASAETVKQ